MTTVFLNGPLRNEFPFKLPAAMLQQSLKRRADCALVRDADDLELAQRLVIIQDGLVCRLEVKLFHQQEEPGSEES
jgi:hypothetical protein